MNPAPGLIRPRAFHSAVFLLTITGLFHWPSVSAGSSLDYQTTPLYRSGGGECLELVSADFDLDGDLDFVVTSTTGWTLMKNDGHATFSPGVETPVANFRGLASGDFDHDGAPDIALLTGTGFSILRNSGGSFELATSILLPSYTSPVRIVTGDFDGNEWSDVVLTEVFPAGVVATIYLNDGEGGFDPSYSQTATRERMAVGRLDGDLIDDFVEGGDYRGGVWLHLSRNTFYPVTQIFSPAARIVEIGDMDGDGRADLVLADDANAISVMRNLGGGAFSAPVVFPTNRRIDDLALGDFDGDGDLDAGALDRFGVVVRILRNDGHGALSDDGTLLGVTLGAAIEAADLDADGFVDLAVATTDYSTPYPWGGALAVLRSLGGAGFEARPEIDLPARPYALAIADYDGDSRLDLAIANGPFNVYQDARVTVRLTTVGSWASRGVDYGVGPIPHEMRAGDLDMDGAPDLVLVAGESGARVQFLWNRGDGSFERGADIPDGPYLPTLALGDVDRDGLPDLAYFTWSGTQGGVKILRNRGGRRFTEMATIALTPIPQDATFSDLDRDGYADLIIAAGDRILVLRNNQGRGLATPVEYAMAAGSAGLGVGDLNGDGAADVGGVDEYSHFLSWLRNRGDGTLGDRTDLTLPYGGFAMTMADVDGDADLDVVAVDGSARIFTNTGDGTLTGPAIFDVGRQFYEARVYAAEITGDAVLDVITMNEGGGTLTLLQTRGAPTIRSVVIDVKPGDASNTIPLGGGEVPVAVRGAPGFPVDRIDPSRLFFEGLKVARGGNGVPKVSISDVDGDGIQDLIASFSTRGLQKPPGEADATLLGMTIEGIRFRGTDHVRYVGPKGPGATADAVANGVAVRVGPNPAREFVEISLAFPGTNPARVELIDTAGRRVATREANASGAIRIPRGDLSAGIYLVRVTYEGREHRHKVALLP